MKIGREECRVILIAPCWPRQLWFRPMVDLLAGRPLRLGARQDLLVDLYEAALPISVAELQLTAWPLSGIATERAAFLNGLRLSSPPVEGIPHSEHTLSVWVPTIGGAVREGILQLELLQL